MEDPVKRLLAAAQDEACPEDSLDDAVHDMVQEGRLEMLNTLEGEDEQEEHIAAGERSASSINNEGMEGQIRFLLSVGLSEEEVKYELGLEAAL
jgi:hypothetical protein